MGTPSNKSSVIARAKAKRLMGDGVGWLGLATIVAGVTGFIMTGGGVFTAAVAILGYPIIRAGRWMRKDATQIIVRAERAERGVKQRAALRKTDDAPGTERSAAREAEVATGNGFTATATPPIGHAGTRGMRARIEGPAIAPAGPEAKTKPPAVPRRGANLSL